MFALHITACRLLWPSIGFISHGIQRYTFLPMFLLSHDLSGDLHYCRSPYFHCSFRAEFLAAETVNTNLPVDRRFSAFHVNCFRGTDLSAFSAADTFTRLKLRKRSHDTRRDEISNFPGNSLAKYMKEDTGLSGYRFKIWNSEAVRVTPN